MLNQYSPNKSPPINFERKTNYIQIIMTNQDLTGKPAGKLTDYLKSKGAVKASLVNGPSGDFVSAKRADDSVFTLPVGKKSQGGKIAEMNVLLVETNEGEVAIATMNNYSVVDEVTL